MKARPGYAANKNKVLARLRRIEGQVRGLTKMVDEERYCIDVLTQVAAAKAALESVSVTLLEDHMQHCVADAIKTGDGTEKVREVSAAIGRLVRS
ncbi:MAG TPA: metal-sensitive transcriptional regulator [Candidatus Micrarchaeaceae archaeon]|nr:metal-sensitive transcriptional regulator [Candidatus Micrarchaeaceae archaeon]